MPAVIRAQPSFTITPMKPAPGSKVNFGATVTDLDLNNISDDDVQALSDAVWTHKVVVVKGQQALAPIKQWELVTRFDPAAPAVHSHGDMKTFNKTGGMLTNARDVVGIPGAENVRLIGKGYQGDDHYGIKGMTVRKPLSHDWHAQPLADADFEAGHTRFQRWHIDAPLYDRDPAWFTTLRCVQRPGRDVEDNDAAPNVTVHWDDGSGQTMTMPPGLTAFFSNVQAYDLMTPAEKQLADHSWVEYAPHPYQWIADCKGHANGLGLAPETHARHRPLDDDAAAAAAAAAAATGSEPPYDLAKIKRYPMVWVNPVTGERALMVHGIAARKLFLRSGDDNDDDSVAPQVVDDPAAIHALLKPLQERVLRPEYILAPATEPGDVVIWANYQMFHSAIDYPIAYGPRTMHQANVGASKGPVGPLPIPLAA